VAPRVKTLKELQSEWYDKLKKDGFEDIENKNNELVSHASSMFYRGRRNNMSFTQIMTDIESKQDYYSLASEFLHAYKFRRPVDKFIWEQHCEGVSYRDISKKLAEKGIKLTRNPIGDIVKKLRVEMKKLYKKEK